MAAGTGTREMRRLLTISIVTYRPAEAELRGALASLRRALQFLDAADVEVTVIDNSPQSCAATIARQELASWKTIILEEHGNIGFGRGHNLALAGSGQFHLILNPDIEMQPGALRLALEFMQANPQCGLLTPLAHWPDGARQYLCKRYPAVFDLVLRGFAPQPIRAWFDNRLAHYEMRAETADRVYWAPPIVSGCFMFFRGEILRTLKGFDPSYFLYFEDFDLSLRAGRLAPAAYVPTVRIVHAGGHAAQKGWRHVHEFGKSAIRFYRRHGLKLF